MHAPAPFLPHLLDMQRASWAASCDRFADAMEDSGDREAAAHYRQLGQMQRNADPSARSGWLP